ncbi:MAG: Gfo/Idh/MocA family oxidoreductase [Planctomycetes bacterium]|nr:Gfo/Idh/MocA family oxidoreductase [Planctomycetota bacterium]
MPTAEPSSSLTRRELLAGAAALPALRALDAAPAVHVAGSDRVRVGLVGCGGRGTGAAMQALGADPGTVITALGEVFPERTDACVGRLGEALGETAGTRLDVPAQRRFLGFDCTQKVLDSGVDVILLCSPPGFRPAQIEAAVDAGVHVFAEKPVAVDAPGIRRVMAAAAKAQEKRVSLVAGFCWRFHAGMRATFERLQQGGIGEIVTVHTTYHAGTLPRHPRHPSWTDMEFQLRNWWHFTWLSGDHIVEQAVHSIDRLAWALGDRMPVRASCLGGRAARSGPEHGHVYDHFAVVYEYADGRRAFHTCRQIDGTPADNTDYVYGTQGSCVINGWTPVFQMKDLKGQPTWSFTGKSKNMYQVEHDELFAAIRKGEPLNDGQHMVQSCLMAILGRMAAYTGQTVTWEQALNSQEDLLPATLAWGPAPFPPVAVPGQTRFR